MWRWLERERGIFLRVEIHFNGSVNSFQILNDGGCSIVLSIDNDTCGLLALPPRPARALTTAGVLDEEKERPALLYGMLLVIFLHLGNAQCINADGCGWLRASADREMACSSCFLPFLSKSPLRRTWWPLLLY